MAKGKDQSEKLLENLGDLKKKSVGKRDKTPKPKQNQDRQNKNITQTQDQETIKLFKKKPKPKEKRHTYYFKTEQIKKIERLSKKTGLPKKEIVQKAIDYFLESIEIN
ncbi:MAG: ribbon-helix-helix domain-containing protein [archaeon]